MGACMCEDKTHMTRRAEGWGDGGGGKKHDTVGVLSRSAASQESKQCLYGVKRLYF